MGTDAQTFIRLGKSLIINGRYIYYVNVSKQQIVLSDSNFPNKFTLSASKEALKALKVGLEESIKSRRIGKHSALKLGRGTLPHKKGKSHDFPVFLTLNLNLYEKNVLQR
ncbi:hypothetical protein [Bacteroides sp. 51]|uniref:hypothetical protein n=1 Tax=Bacteroides sp. 51 TaxID=2302938 RepID=UPI0013D3A4F6|nr:hypothetical protein [Bacteroides sp. 51]NDV81269.1 hypothetical protein [Bacteroides sp. 51]